MISYCPDLMYLGIYHDEYDYPRRDKKKEKKRSKAIHLLASLDDNFAMRNAMIKMIMNDSLDYMIHRYAKKENLPEQHVETAREPDCISIVLRGFFKHIATLPLNTKLVCEIANLADEIQENSSMEIVYTRVGKIQSFIHEKVNIAQGVGAHAQLPSIHMKNLLSTCRLHLNMEEIKNRNSEYLLEIIKKSEAAAKEEIKNPSRALMFPVKNYIPHWRINHMRSLFYYARYDMRELIEKVINISDEFPSEKYREKLILEYEKFR